MAKGSIKIGDEIVIIATVRKRVTEDPLISPAPLDCGHHPKRQQRAED